MSHEFLGVVVDVWGGLAGFPFSVVLRCGCCLLNLITIISLPFVFTWFTGSQIFLKLQGRWGASKFSVERFYSSLNVYPESAWSFSAAGSLGWTDRDKSWRASAPGAAQPTTFSVFPSALGSCPVWANWVKMPLMWPRWLFQLHVSALTLCLDSEVWRAVVLGALVSVGSKQLTDLWCPSLRVCEWTVCARPCVGPVTARGCIFPPLPRWKQWLYNLLSWHWHFSVWFVGGSSVCRGPGWEAVGSRSKPLWRHSGGARTPPERDYKT